MLFITLCSIVLSINMCSKLFEWFNLPKYCVSHKVPFSLIPPLSPPLYKPLGMENCVLDSHFSHKVPTSRLFIYNVKGLNTLVKTHISHDTKVKLYSKKYPTWYYGGLNNEKSERGGNRNCKRHKIHGEGKDGKCRGKIFIPEKKTIQHGMHVCKHTALIRIQWSI